MSKIEIISHVINLQIYSYMNTKMKGINPPLHGKIVKYLLDKLT